MQLTERLHSLLLDGRVQPKEAISFEQGFDTLATLIRIYYLAAPEGSVEGSCIAELARQSQSMAGLASSSGCQAAAPGAVLAMARAAACILGFRAAVPEVSVQSREELKAIAELAATVANQLDCRPAAAELDAALAAARLSFQLTARQVQQTCLEVQGDALAKLALTLQPEPFSAEQVMRHNAALIVPLARRLAAMDASRRKYHANLAFALTNTLDFAGAAAALRTAVRLATEQRGEWGRALWLLCDVT
ncbi:hypothetical protein ABPG75_000765 [Micractinium tetrahymenae]